MSLDIPPKPARKPSSKGAPPPPPVAEDGQLPRDHTDRPARDAQVMMNFKESAEFRQDYKMFAAQHGMTMSQVLRDSFNAFKQAKNGAPAKAKK